MLQTAYLDAITGFDTEENEPPKVWEWIIHFYSFASLTGTRLRAAASAAAETLPNAARHRASAPRAEVFNARWWGDESALLLQDGRKWRVQLGFQRRIFGCVLVIKLCEVFAVEHERVFSCRVQERRDIESGKRRASGGEWIIQSDNWIISKNSVSYFSPTSEK